LLSVATSADRLVAFGMVAIVETTLALPQALASRPFTLIPSSVPPLCGGCSVSGAKGIVYAS
jgi:hypothetical protein